MRLYSQLGKSIAQGSGQFSFRKVYAGETRELLDESVLTTAIVRSPSDIRRLNVIRGNTKKSIQRQILSTKALSKTGMCPTGRTNLSPSIGS